MGAVHREVRDEEEEEEERSKKQEELLQKWLGIIKSTLQVVTHLL